MISVNLNIKSQELDPVFISNLLETKPSHSFKKGDVRKGSQNSIRSYGGWSLRSSVELTSNDIDTHFELIENFVFNKFAELTQIRKLHPKSEIWVEIDFDKTQDFVSLSIQAKSLSKLAHLVDLLQISMI